jgi:hypothetical protein
MKKSKKKSRPNLPTCGNACITVSNRERMPLAFFNSLKTRAMRNTCITCISVGCMGITDLLADNLSKNLPTIDIITIMISGRSVTRLKQPCALWPRRGIWS